MGADNNLLKQGRGEMPKPAKNTICLWYDGGAEEAARFYALTFPDSSVGKIVHAPADYPECKKGEGVTVDKSRSRVRCELSRRICNLTR